MINFSHLHCHSYFSFLDGCNSPEELVEMAANLGMSSIAITDHDNLCGAVKFQQAAKKANIKPIIGSEITLENNHHLTLLATNIKGYNNLCKILTESYKKGGRYQPKTPFSALEKYNENLIALSGCHKGEIPTLLLNRQFHEALVAAKRYVNIFTQGNFYLETQNLLHPGDKVLQSHICQLSQQLNLKVVATNNTHFLKKDSFALHDILTCIRTNTTLNQIHKERRLNAECYFKSQREMESLFKSYPMALENIQELEERCQEALPTADRLFPSYPLPPSTNAAAFLKEIVYQGASERYTKLTQAIRDRLEGELNVIFNLGFQDYFLMVWDLVQYALRMKIRYELEVP